MTAQEFIDWLQTANNLPNPTQAVKRAAQMMRVTEDAVWKWLNTKKPHPTPEYMQLLMELLHEKYREKRFHRILSHEQREEMRSMLGKVPDSEIAERLGISLNVVARNRRKLKIAPAPYSPIKDADKDIILNLLGRVSDLKIAKKTGYSVYVIKKFREQNKIKPFSKSILERFSPDQRKKLLSMLGKVYDRVIAEKFNIDDEAVRRIRQKLNVPALREEKSLQETIEGDEYIKSLLGTMTDKEVANKTGKSIQVIGKARRKLNIPAFDTRGRSTKKQS